MSWQEDVDGWSEEVVRLSNDPHQRAPIMGIVHLICAVRGLENEFRQRGSLARLSTETAEAWISALEKAAMDVSFPTSEQRLCHAALEAVAAGRASLPVPRRESWSSTGGRPASFFNWYKTPLDHPLLMVGASALLVAPTIVVSGRRVDHACLQAATTENCAERVRAAAPLHVRRTRSRSVGVPDGLRREGCPLRRST